MLDELGTSKFRNMTSMRETVPVPGYLSFRMTMFILNISQQKLNQYLAKEGDYRKVANQEFYM